MKRFERQCVTGVGKNMEYEEIHRDRSEIPKCEKSEKGEDRSGRKGRTGEDRSVGGQEWCGEMVWVV